MLGVGVDVVVPVVVVLGVGVAVVVPVVLGVGVGVAVVVPVAVPVLVGVGVAVVVPVVVVLGVRLTDGAKLPQIPLKQTYCGAVEALAAGIWGQLRPSDVGVMTQPLVQQGVPHWVIGNTGSVPTANELVSKGPDRPVG